MKILKLTISLQCGGAESQLIDQADFLARLGHDVQICSMMPIEENLHPKLHNLNLPLHSLDMRYKSDFFSSYLKAIRLINDIKPEIIHAHMSYANIFARLLRIFCSVPVLVCSAHSMYERPTSKPQLDKEFTTIEFLYRVTDFLCDITSQESKTAMQRYVNVKAVPKNKICVIRNGVNISNEIVDISVLRSLKSKFNIPENTFIWLNVARLHKFKNQILLINAFSQTKDSVLIILGSGDQRIHLEARIAELKLENRVFLLGMQDNVSDFYQMADALVYSSIFEGLPIAMIEGQLFGLVVVTTSVGGVPELIQDGINGFLVPNENTKILAERMNYVESLSMEMMQDMQDKARSQVIEHFSIDAVMKQWLDIYQSKLTNARNR
jgi:glycosyltransferase involved in cell wall biosynthesis